MTAPVVAVAKEIYAADAAKRATENGYVAWDDYADKEDYYDLARVAIAAYREYEKEEEIK